MCGVRSLPWLCGFLGLWRPQCGNCRLRSLCRTRARRRGTRRWRNGHRSVGAFSMMVQLSRPRRSCRRTMSQPKFRFVLMICSRIYVHMREFVWGIRWRIFVRIFVCENGMYMRTVTDLWLSFGVRIFVRDGCEYFMFRFIAIMRYFDGKDWTDTFGVRFGRDEIFDIYILIWYCFILNFWSLYNYRFIDWLWLKMKIKIINLKIEQSWSISKSDRNRTMLLHTNAIGSVME